MPYLLDTNAWIHYLKNAVEYGRIRHELETTGQVIGPNDLLIAAICIRHGFTLVTSNVSEFSRVQGLLIEDWLLA